MFDSWKQKNLDGLRESTFIEFHNEKQLEDMRKLMKKKRKGLYRDDVLDFNDFKVAFWFDFKEDIKIIARGLTIDGDVRVGDIECSQYIKVAGKLFAGDISCKDLEVEHESYLEAKNIEVEYAKDSVPVVIYGSIKANDIKIHRKGINFYGEDASLNDITSKGDIRVIDGTLKANDIKTNCNIVLSDCNVNVRDIYAGAIEGSGTIETRDIDVKSIEGHLNIKARDILSSSNDATLIGQHSIKARSIARVMGNPLLKYSYREISVAHLEVNDVLSEYITVKGNMKAGKVSYGYMCVVLGSLECKDVSGSYKKGLVTEILQSEDDM